MKVRILNKESRFREDDPIFNVEKLVFLKTGMVQLWLKDVEKPPYSIQIRENRIIDVTDSEQPSNSNEGSE